MDDDRARALIAHRKAQQAKRSTALPARLLIAELRALYYDKQRAFFTSKHKRRATRKTRRSGATTGGCREFVARALEVPGWRGTYVASTRNEARDRAWRSDTKSGFVDLLEQFGKLVDIGNVVAYRLGGINVQVREQDLALEFSNGSRINLFGADDERSLRKQRGNAKHVYWIDEAQDFRFLEEFYKAVVVGALVDYRGECWLTGTPSKDCAGLFYEVTREDPTPEYEQAWEVHSIAVVDNPYFGKTESERWENTAGAAIRENGWAADDPDLLREWFARWIRTDANYVYAVHSVLEHELCYAPSRMAPDGFPDIKRALLDLPGADARREYFLAMGADLGTRDDFALVIWAWSLQDPILYEVCSFKQPGLDYDEMALHLNSARSQAVIGLVTADAGGGGKPAVMGWSKKWVDRYNIPIIEATKTNKAMAIKQVNNDIRRGMLRLRSGGPLLAEMKVHRWAKIRSASGAQVEDPTTPNHACDAGLYGHRESFHHRHRPPEVIPPKGSQEWLLREEQEMEQDAYDGEGQGFFFQ